MSNDRMTVVPDFLGELDAGVFINKIAAALNTTALGVLNNGNKGKVVLTFDFERMGNSVEEKRVKIILPDYQVLEARVDAAIRKKFGLPAEQHPTVKYADLVMLASERRDFEIDDGTHWPMLDGIIPTDQFVINPVRPGQSYGMFMNRFNQLVERR
ncbi:hypothetical protein E4K08_07615 [Raoultella ornithinolytica]|uniref:hypothetical protein n=1 Tax=Raoultella ornithinolytica TaxID=54291 RepID=UPI0010BE75A6|nr:hypothetical protein [Raoultella ornithinolytica]QCK76516.1 hypothetical protein E4K08_07615 [Raoultella ornithinolytica]